MKKSKLLVIPIILVILALLLGKLGIFTLNRLDVEINNANCATIEEVKLSSGLIGSNSLFINTNAVSGKLLDKYPCIGAVEMARTFPSSAKLMVYGRAAFTRLVEFKEAPKLDLNLSEATPSSQSALLDWSKPAISSDQFLVDKNGVIFAISKANDLPLLSLSQEIKVGQRLDSELFNKISAIFAGLGSLETTAIDAKLENTDLLILSPQRIAFSLRKDVQKQIISLQLILQKAKIEESKMETIDLRFDKPVVVYNLKK